MHCMMLLCKYSCTFDNSTHFLMTHILKTFSVICSVSVLVFKESLVHSETTLMSTFLATVIPIHNILLTRQCHKLTINIHLVQYHYKQEKQ